MRLTTTWVLDDPHVYCCNPPKGHRKWHALQQHWSLPPRIQSKAVNIDLLGIALTPENSRTDSSELESQQDSPQPKRKSQIEVPRAKAKKPSSISIISRLREVLEQRKIQPPSTSSAESRTDFSDESSPVSLKEQVSCRPQEDAQTRPNNEIEYIVLDDLSQSSDDNENHLLTDAPIKSESPAENTQVPEEPRNEEHEWLKDIELTHETLEGLLHFQFAN